MSDQVQARVQVAEVATIVTPVEGVNIYTALQDAKLAGFRSIEVDEKANTAVIVWFKRES